MQRAVFKAWAGSSLDCNWLGFQLFPYICGMNEVHAADRHLQMLECIIHMGPCAPCSLTILNYIGFRMVV
jgi:hypothetical protein